MSGTHPADTRVVSLADLLTGAVAAAPVARLPLAEDEAVTAAAQPPGEQGRAPAPVARLDALTGAHPRDRDPGERDPGEQDPGEPAGRRRRRRPARSADGGRAGARTRLAGRPASGGTAEGAHPADGAPAEARAPAGRRPVPVDGQADPGADPEADPIAVARAICLRLLTERAHTRDELARALRRKGVPDDAAADVLGRFDEVGLIDDEAFAEQWVRSRHAHRGLGRRALAVELRRKGVADEIAVEAVAAVDDESEERRARELVVRRVRSLRTETPELRAAAGRKLVGMLARKGYGGGVAYRVVREVLAERGAEAEELGTEPPADD
ncbi:RecX family transcriptional regulator [Pseudonocardia sp.]|uniref:regulatory protein RecX n=1 Tax=Pseudonocardia sp. TaxID=60912 RepID=UPI003D0B27F5